VSARRRSEVPALVEDDPRKGMVEIFMERHKSSIEALAPLVGAAVGAMALEAASQHVAMKKHEIALLGAGVAFLAGANASGPLRQLAMGAAAGAACYGLVEVLREGHPAWLYKQPKPEAAQRQAAPPDAMTRADLDNALARLNEGHQAELAAIRQSYEAQIGELQSAVHSLLNELRRERGDDAVESAAVTAAKRLSAASAPPTTESPVAATESSGPADARRGMPERDAATETGASIGVDQAAHFGAIYSLLTTEERVRVSSMMAGVSPAMLAKVQRELLTMTPERAVTHLRRNVFPSRAKA
jgi:hypothetical protein